MAASVVAMAARAVAKHEALEAARRVGRRSQAGKRKAKSRLRKARRG